MAEVIGVLEGDCNKETIEYTLYIAIRTTRNIYIYKDSGEGLIYIV